MMLPRVDGGAGWTGMSKPGAREKKAKVSEQGADRVLNFKGCYILIMNKELMDKGF